MLDYVRVINFRIIIIIIIIMLFSNKDKILIKKFYLQSVWGKTHYFKHQKYQIFGWITKLEAIKMQFVCISAISAEYLQKIWIFNFPR